MLIRYFSLLDNLYSLAVSQTYDVDALLEAVDASATESVDLCDSVVVGSVNRVDAVHNILVHELDILVESVRLLVAALTATYPLIVSFFLYAFLRCGSSDAPILTTSTARMMQSEATASISTHS